MIKQHNLTKRPNMRPHKSAQGSNVNTIFCATTYEHGQDDNMEKRYSKRLPIVMDVLLYDKNMPVVFCKTHDIGADGLFVDSGPLTYRNDTILKIEFQLESETGKESHLLPAMVVRSSKTGLGLMLPGGNVKAMKAWRLKVRQASTENSLNKLNDILDQPSTPNVRTRK